MQGQTTAILTKFSSHVGGLFAARGMKMLGKCPRGKIPTPEPHEQILLILLINQTWNCAQALKIMCKNHKRCAPVGRLYSEIPWKFQFLDLPSLHHTAGMKFSVKSGPLINSKFHPYQCNMSPQSKFLRLWIHQLRSCILLCSNFLCLVELGWKVQWLGEKY